MRLHGFLSVLWTLVITTSATNQNLGCSKCLGDSKDNVRLGCYQMCSQAFNPSSSEYEKCRFACSDFVFDKNCCTGACSSNANKCMNTFFPPSIFSKRDLPSMRGHSRDFVPSTPRDLVNRNASDATDLIEARLDYGKSCCDAANIILASSTTKIIPLIQAQRWDENTAAGLMLIGFGLAAAKACNMVFGATCLFQVGNEGPVAGGGLPPPGF
ncbi:hypothetical protein BJ170DRAFT_677786 [Xylariales sp. AK1849]|nr:hypothetical protein BJ170DRAFT_677786 [Xylariales sp. AK1849]